MNVRRITPAITVLTLLVVPSCKDDDARTLTLSHEEVAHMVATAISESTSGFTVVLNNSISKTDDIVEAHETKTDCGFAEDHSITSQNQPGADHTFLYTHNYSYELSCGGTEPLHMNTEVKFEGEFDTPRLTSQHIGTINLMISALNDNNGSYHVTGEYLNDGVYESRVNTKSIGENVVSFSSTDIKVNKLTREITSGTAQASITGTLPDKRNFAGEASVTFRDKGIVVINVRGLDFVLETESGDLNSVSN